MRTPIQILIADDHEVVREGLEAILRSQVDLDLVGVAKNGLEAVNLAGSLQPDVILMDLVMPVMGGLEAIQAIQENCSQARILVLTSFADDEQVFPAIKAGALGYLLKDSTKEVLLNAIHEVAQGHITLHPSIARRIVREINKPMDIQPYDEVLTHREVQTLRLIAKGLSNQEIAESLSVHENTIAKYVSAILKKLQLVNRTQAALYALRNGIINLN